VPTLPWLPPTPPELAAEAPVVVMASRFRLRRLHQVPRFFLAAMRIHRQVRGADGLLGVSLVAHPLRREFLTLSAWRDRAALDAMVRRDAHRGGMRRHRAAMAEARFTFWTAARADLPIDWADARRRLDDAA
jgi:heme-degrading monooxygenase HmoA